MRAPLTLPTRPCFALVLALRRIAARVILGVLMVGTMYAVALDTSQLRQQLAVRFGPERVALLNGWLKTTTDASALGDSEKLKRINEKRLTA